MENVRRKTLFYASPEIKDGWFKFFYLATLPEQQTSITPSYPNNRDLNVQILEECIGLTKCTVYCFFFLTSIPSLRSSDLQQAHLQKNITFGYIWFFGGFIRTTMSFH